MAGDEQFARPIQRVVFVAAMAKGLVLDSAAHFVECAVGEFHDVERVSDLLRVRERGVERGAVRP